MSGRCRVALPRPAPHRIEPPVLPWVWRLILCAPVGHVPRWRMFVCIVEPEPSAARNPKAGGSSYALRCQRPKEICPRTDVCRDSLPRRAAAPTCPIVVASRHNLSLDTANEHATFERSMRVRAVGRGSSAALFVRRAFLHAATACYTLEGMVGSRATGCDHWAGGSLYALSLQTVASAARWKRWGVC